MSRRRPEPPAERQAESEDPESIVRSILLRRLSMAPRTRVELEKDLTRRGADPDVAARVLDRFTDVGLIDDAAFARMWVESRHRGKALARSVLSHELRMKGVDKDIIDEALEQVDDDDELARARAFAQSKARLRAGEDAAKAVNRLASQLARKGYPAAVCFQVARERLAAMLEERDDHLVDELSAGVIVEDFPVEQESV
jgi:regulatory protein